MPYLMKRMPIKGSFDIIVAIIAILQNCLKMAYFAKKRALKNSKKCQKYSNK